jgi:hypothetical protein
LQPHRGIVCEIKERIKRLAETLVPGAPGLCTIRIHAIFVFAQ